MTRGTVIVWHVDKHFGWLAIKGGARAFAHRSEVVELPRDLSVGDRVEFDAVVTPRGLRAVRIMRIVMAPATNEPREVTKLAQGRTQR